MVFEEQVSKLYNEIANKINEMILAEWEQVYTMAYIDEEGTEVFFNYTKPGSNDLHHYTDIPKDYNVSEEIFDELSDELYDLFERLRGILKKIIKNHGHHVNLILIMKVN